MTTSKPIFNIYDPRSKTGNERYGDWGWNKDLFEKDLKAWKKKRNRKKTKKS